MSQRSVLIALSAAVATNGTFTVSYPDDYDRGDFEGAPHHSFTIGNMGPYNHPDDFTLSFGATEVTVTYTGTTTLPQGVSGYFTFDQVGDQANYDTAYDNKGVREAHTVLIQLGSPDTLDANGYVESQDLTALGVFSIDTTAAAAIADAALAGEADVPRNVKAAWTGTAVLTVTGTDVDGNVVVESSASGTSMTGKKAFKTVTDVSTSANITALTVGTADVFGLPVYLPGDGNVLTEIEDGDQPTAGTIVAGLSPNTPSTATTGDVRGTYDPNSAANGALRFELMCALPDPTHKGNDQYAG